MKNVANCDNYCELHLVNHQVFERILHSLVFQRVHLFQYHINPNAVCSFLKSNLGGIYESLADERCLIT